MYQSYSSMMLSITDACCSMDGPNWKNMEWSSWKTETKSKSANWASERGGNMQHIHIQALILTLRHIPFVTDFIRQKKKKNMRGQMFTWFINGRYSTLRHFSQRTDSLRWERLIRGVTPWHSEVYIIIQIFSLITAQTWTPRLTAFATSDGWCNWPLESVIYHSRMNKSHAALSMTIPCSPHCLEHSRNKEVKLKHPCLEDPLPLLCTAAPQFHVHVRSYTHMWPMRILPQSVSTISHTCSPSRSTTG